MQPAVSSCVLAAEVNASREKGQKVRGPHSGHRKL